MAPGVASGSIPGGGGSARAASTAGQEDSLETSSALRASVSSGRAVSGSDNGLASPPSSGGAEDPGLPQLSHDDWGAGDDGSGGAVLPVPASPARSGSWVFSPAPSAQRGDPEVVPCSVNKGGGGGTGGAEAGFPVRGVGVGAHPRLGDVGRGGSVGAMSRVVVFGAHPVDAPGGVGIGGAGRVARALIFDTEPGKPSGDAAAKPISLAQQHEDAADRERRILREEAVRETLRATLASGRGAFKSGQLVNIIRANVGEAAGGAAGAAGAPGATGARSIGIVPAGEQARLQHEKSARNANANAAAADATLQLRLKSAGAGCAAARGVAQQPSGRLLNWCCSPLVGLHSTPGATKLRLAFGQGLSLADLLLYERAHAETVELVAYWWGEVISLEGEVASEDRACEVMQTLSEANFVHGVLLASGLDGRNVLATVFLLDDSTPNFSRRITPRLPTCLDGLHQVASCAAHLVELLPKPSVIGSAVAVLEDAQASAKERWGTDLLGHQLVRPPATAPVPELVRWLAERDDAERVHLAASFGNAKGIREAASAMRLRGPRALLTLLSGMEIADRRDEAVAKAAAAKAAAAAAHADAAAASLPAFFQRPVGGADGATGGNEGASGLKDPAAEADSKVLEGLWATAEQQSSSSRVCDLANKAQVWILSLAFAAPHFTCTREEDSAAEGRLLSDGVRDYVVRLAAACRAAGTRPCALFLEASLGWGAFNARLMSLAREASESIAATTPDDELDSWVPERNADVRVIREAWPTRRCAIVTAAAHTARLSAEKEAAGGAVVGDIADAGSPHQSTATEQAHNERAKKLLLAMESTVTARLIRAIFFVALIHQDSQILDIGAVRDLADHEIADEIYYRLNHFKDCYVYAGSALNSIVPWTHEIYGRFVIGTLYEMLDPALEAAEEAREKEEMEKLTAELRRRKRQREEDAAYEALQDEMRKRASWHDRGGADDEDLSWAQFCRKFPSGAEGQQWWHSSSNKRRHGLCRKSW